jgi:hypothetical protein
VLSGGGSDAEQSGRDGKETEWSGRGGGEVLAPRHSDVGDKTTGIRGWWPPTVYSHRRITMHGVVCVRE